MLVQTLSENVNEHPGPLHTLVAWPPTPVLSSHSEFVPPLL